MWLTDLLHSAFARAFDPPPDMPIWKWADQNVWLESQAASEAGFYRSAKTPWTRRLQDLMQDPRMFVPDLRAIARRPSFSEECELFKWSFDNPGAVWKVVRVGEYNSKKSSQSGFSEAALNGIRWRSCYRPCNTIYTIDTREEALNISKRLESTLMRLGDSGAFTGDDKELGTLVMHLRAMEVWFYGSFSSGKFANKQAELVVSDEIEEHGKSSSTRNLKSRKKTAENGLQINLSKPQLKGGPICKLFDSGNQEEYQIKCPHPDCGEWQWFTFFPSKKKVPFSKQLVLVEKDGLRQMLPIPLPLGQEREVKTGRVNFEHCKDALGRWDELSIMEHAYHECGYCGREIPNSAKPELVETALWLPTAIGSPGIVSQHMSDLNSSDSASSVGQISLDFLGAKRGGRVELQGFYNHRAGLEFAEEANKTEVSDIAANIAGANPEDACPPYKKGEFPLVPHGLILGGDIGGNYAKWALLAILENQEDCAVIDWGEELDPSDITDLMNFHDWKCGPKSDRFKITYGFLDAKFRKRDALRACLGAGKRRLIPTVGLGGSAARNIKLWAYNRIPGYGPDFRHLAYNDREAKNDLYIECWKKKIRRVFLPVDVLEKKHEQFVAEITAERMIPVDDGYEWDEEPPPNHWGDCVKDGLMGFRYLTRHNKPTAGPQETEEPGAGLAPLAKAAA